MPANEGQLIANFRALALFRIGLSAWLLADFLQYQGCCFDAFFGADGVLPVTDTTPNIPVKPLALPLLAFLESIGLTTALPVLYPAGVIAFGIGYRTRVANAVVFALNCYLGLRNPVVMSGADSLAHLLLLWCLFLPMNRQWSVDARLDPGVRERPYAWLPLLAIRLQVCSVYVFAALAKLAGGPWRDGYAVVWALSDNTFGATLAGSYLVENVPGLLFYVGYCIVAFQLSFPFLVFCPWRNDLTRGLALAGAAIMHVSFILCLYIGGFPYISLVALLVLVPDAWINRAVQRGREGLARMRSGLGPDWQGAMAHAPAQALPAGALWRLAQADQPPSRLDVTQDPGGPPPAPVTSPAGSPPPARTQPRARRLAVAVCVFLALLGLAINLDSIARIKDNPEPSTVQAGYRLLLHDVASVLQVAQAWYLFAPVPTHFRRSFQILGHTADGRVTDPTKDLPALLFRERADGSGLDFPHHRWRKYFSRVEEFSEGEWAGLGRYVCRWLQRELALSSGVLQAVEIVASKEDVDYRATTTSPSVKRRKVACT